MLAKLSETIAAHLRFQIESGAQLIQLFDTWAGELAPSDYEEFALPYTRDILESLGDHVPRILYVNGCSTLVESMARSGADVLSVDWRVSLKDVRKRIGHRLGLQGNLDPGLLLGHTDRMLAQTRRILEEAGPRGHILNLGHGVLPATPVGHARALVDLVKTYRHAG